MDEEGSSKTFFDVVQHSIPILACYIFITHNYHFTLTSKANATKRNVMASVSDDAVMRTIHHLLDICLLFQLYLLLFGHLVIVLGQ